MSDDESGSTSVSVYIYDLTSGLAQMFSQALLGEFYRVLTGPAR